MGWAHELRNIYGGYLCQLRDSYTHESWCKTPSSYAKTSVVNRFNGDQKAPAGGEDIILTELSPSGGSGQFRRWQRGSIEN